MSPVDNLQERLKAMQGAFNDAVPDAPGGGPMPPDGKYQALVHAFDTFESGKGQAFLKTQLQLAVDGDEWNGHVVETVHNLEDPERIAWVKQHLQTLGLDVDSLDLAALFDQLEQLLDVPVAITITRSAKTNDQGQHYVNVYVDKRLGNPMPKSDVPPPPPEQPVLDPNDKKDDIPF